MYSEYKRQAIHICLGIVLLALVYFFWFNWAALAFAAIAFGGMALSILLRKQVFKSKFLLGIIGSVQRGKGIHIHGEPALWFIFGACLTLLLFPVKMIAFGALLVLTFGDSAATMAGMHFGKTRLRGKRTVEGTVAAIAVSFVLLSFFFPLHQAFAAAFIGMLAEYIPYIDDNVSVPIAAGIALTLIL